MGEVLAVREEYQLRKEIGGRLTAIHQADMEGVLWALRNHKESVLLLLLKNIRQKDLFCHGSEWVCRIRCV